MTVPRCPAKMRPAHPNAELVRCRYTMGDHAVHYGVDVEAPRTERRWLDSQPCAVVDSHGDQLVEVRP